MVSIMFFFHPHFGKWSNLTIICFGWVENTQLDHYNNIWHFGFALQRHGPCSRKAGALHGLLWVPGGFAPRVPMASMIFIVWKSSNPSVPVVQNLQVLPHERRLSGLERCHAQGLDRREVVGWEAGWMVKMSKTDEVHVKMSCPPRK